MKFQHYDNAGRRWGLSPQKVAAIVRKHKLTKRRIYGNMAVDAEGFERVMQESGAKPKY